MSPGSGHTSAMLPLPGAARLLEKVLWLRRPTGDTMLEQNSSPYFQSCSSGRCPENGTGSGVGFQGCFGDEAVSIILFYIVPLVVYTLHGWCCSGLSLHCVSG